MDDFKFERDEVVRTTVDECNGLWLIIARRIQGAHRQYNLLAWNHSKTALSFIDEDTIFRDPVVDFRKFSCVRREAAAREQLIKDTRPWLT